MKRERRINFLKEYLEYDKPAYIKDKDLFPDREYIPIEGSCIFVKTKHKGFDRFYSLVEYTRATKTIYHIYHVIALGDGLGFDILNPQARIKIAKQYFSDYLMESIL
jgi:hypothetical protein